MLTMDEKYKDIGFPPDQLIEECSEVITECSSLIKLICKARRFGWDSNHPAEVETNLQRVSSELGDLEIRIYEFRKWLEEKGNAR